MRLLTFTLLPAFVRAFSWSAYDFGFHGIYPTQKYVSVDFLSPNLRITQWDSRCDDGNILLSPRGKAIPSPGPVMLDARGNLVWMEEKFGQAMNFQVQKYKGQDYLTFWRGSDHAAHSNGSYVLIDSSYELAHEVSAVGLELTGDLHEFHITESGTALITIYHNHEIDCTDLGLGSSCWINDSLFQEINIETGELIFQWQASDNVRMSDTFKWPTGIDGQRQEHAFDFFHINSVDKDPLGNYYVSSRYLHSVICIDPSGKTLWYLGGKNNSFTDLSDGEAINFSWQHHVNWHAKNTLSIFDNHGDYVFHNRAEFSRGLKVALDLEAMTATLVEAYIHPDEILAISQGSMQILPDSGNVLVGFGNSPAFTEFSAEGEVLCDAHFGPAMIFEILDLGLVKSYRTFKSHWVGRPKDPPAVKVKDGKAYVSWNGATEVKSWRLQSAEVGAADEEFLTIQELERSGFETSFELDDVSEANVRIAALDANRSVLAYSAIVSASSPTIVSFWQIMFFVCGFAGFGFLCWRYQGVLLRNRRLGKPSSLLTFRSWKIDRQSYELLESQE